MAIALGFNTAVNSVYLGFGLHIITGSIVGAILEPSQQNGKTSLLNPYKTSVGVGAGITIWLILFLPITALLIQPSISRIVAILVVQTHSQYFPII